MTVVSNTTPLRYLIAAGYDYLLNALFGTILIPRGVAAELLDEGAPSSVRTWMAVPPEWLSIVVLQSAPDPELVFALDRGEREATPWNCVRIF